MPPRTEPPSVSIATDWKKKNVRVQLLPGRIPGAELRGAAWASTKRRQNGPNHSAQWKGERILPSPQSAVRNLRLTVVPPPPPLTMRFSRFPVAAWFVWKEWHFLSSFLCLNGDHIKCSVWSTNPLYLSHRLSAWREVGFFFFLDWVGVPIQTSKNTCGEFLAKWRKH